MHMRYAHMNIFYIWNEHCFFIVRNLLGLNKKLLLQYRRRYQL